jgi:hypothetical protein
VHVVAAIVPLIASKTVLDFLTLRHDALGLNEKCRYFPSDYDRIVACLLHAASEHMGEADPKRYAYLPMVRYINSGQYNEQS